MRVEIGSQYSHIYMVQDKDPDIIKLKDGPIRNDANPNIANIGNESDNGVPWAKVILMYTSRNMIIKISMNNLGAIFINLENTWAFPSWWKK